MFYTQAPPSLGTWETLTPLLQTMKPQFVLPSLKAFRAMNESDRRVFDAERKKFVAGELTVQTPAVVELIKAAQNLMQQNQHPAIGRRGILVTGPSTVGKTTACLSLMRYVYQEFEWVCPTELEAGAIPVAYVEVPPSSTPKGLMQRFADFYAIPYQSRTSLNELKRAVVHVMRGAMTQLVIVDELHNLSRISHQNGESVDTLKDLSNDAPATFIYAGIKLEQSGLLAGARGDQVARRFSPLRIPLYKYDSPEDRKTWRGIVMAFSRALPLYAHDPADLVKHAQWLHTRSGGSIGTLQSILVQAVHQLIDRGVPEQESLTLELLTQARRDVRAEALDELSTRAQDSGVRRPRKKPAKKNVA